MIVTDPIADYLTRIRNAQSARHKIVVIPSSKIKKSITEILYNQGFILKYKFEDNEDSQGKIYIGLKYNKEDNKPVIRKMQRVSRPGLRKYSPVSEIPRVINGLGTAIISTSKGLMTGKKAQEENVGGEVLCFVY